MRNTRLMVAILAALSLTLIVGTAAAHIHKGDRIEGSGDLETREFDLKNFDEIDIGGAFEVAVRLGDSQSVAVTVDDNLWDNLEVEVKGGRLIVGWDESCEPDDDCRLEITVSSLKAMTIHGAANVEIDDFSGERFEFDLSGAAQLEMNGTVDDLDIEVSGAGNIDTRKLKAHNVKIHLSGAANADITATTSLEAKVSGVGSINYWGDPEVKETKVSGLGSISAK